MIYGYARVSTAHQMKDGNSLDDQRTKLKGSRCTGDIRGQFHGNED